MEIKHLTINIDSELKKKFIIKCAEKDETMTDVLARLIGKYLNDSNN